MKVSEIIERRLNAEARPSEEETLSKLIESGRRIRNWQLISLAVLAAAIGANIAASVHHFIVAFGACQ